MEGRSQKRRRDENSPINEINDEMVPEPKRKRLPLIVDGTFFKSNEWDEATNIATAVCTQCDKLIKAQTKSTGNFFKHYQHSHKDKHAELKTHCKNNKDDEKSAHRTSRQSILPFTNVLDTKKV